MKLKKMNQFHKLMSKNQLINLSMKIQDKRGSQK